MDDKSPRITERHKKEYSEVHRRVKRLIRTDKRNYHDDLTSQVEDGTARHEHGQQDHN